MKDSVLPALKTPLYFIYRYNHANHRTRINYYSTPDQTVRVNGQPVGEANLSDNRRVIEANAISYRNIGDESGDCPALAGNMSFPKK